MNSDHVMLAHRTLIALLLTLGSSSGCTFDSGTTDPATSNTTASNTATSNATTGGTDAGDDVQDTAIADADPADAPDDTTAAMDTASADTSDTRTPDTAAPDTAPDEPDAPAQALTLSITSPRPGDIFEQGRAITFEAQITNSPIPAEELSVVWVSSEDGLFASRAPEADGQMVVTTDRLSRGDHTVTMRATGPGGLEAEASVSIGVCSWTQPETFDGGALGEGWETFGSAYLDPNGWLEMTGLSMGQQGAIFNTSNIINPGNISISVRILTGGGTGADGFAMSVIQAESPEELRQIINSAGSGGALGYGYGGDWGTYDDVPGFHIEFDTWYNVYNGGNEFHTDPTPENHIGVTLDGDPGNHYLWAELPNIEDQRWHDINIEINGRNVVVTMDGESVIDGFIEQLDFKGGYIGFSGTTGYYTNYHRFDDLQVRQECLVE